MRIVTDYKHAQQIIIELDARIAKLEAALYPIGKLGYDQTPRQLGMSVKALSRIRALIANSEERTVTEKYHDDLMHEWKVSEVAKDNRIADLEAELVKAWKKLLKENDEQTARIAKLEAANRKLWRGYFDLPKLDSEVENNE